MLSVWGSFDSSDPLAARSLSHKSQDYGVYEVGIFSSRVWGLAPGREVRVSQKQSISNPGTDQQNQGLHFNKLLH